MSKNNILPKNLRPATSKDIQLGAEIWHLHNNEGNPFKNIVEYIIKPDDLYKAYCAEDGCRYGLDDAFIEIKESKIFQLLIDWAAGDCMIKEWSKEEWDNWEESGVRNQYGFYTEYGFYETKEELNEAIEKAAGPTVFAVFYNRAAGDAIWSPENNLSGNWKGSKHSPYTYFGHYKTEEEAKKRVRTLCR